ncbi:hypothetical protein P7C70_g3623, partial [Phenoliferia sp. Uapishka_3]
MSTRASQKRKDPPRSDNDEAHHSSSARSRVRRRAHSPESSRVSQRKRKIPSRFDSETESSDAATQKKRKRGARLCGVKATLDSQACRKQLKDGETVCEQHSHQPLSGVAIPIDQWPPHLNAAELQHLHRTWRAYTSLQDLRQVPCASCASFCNDSTAVIVSEFDPHVDLSPLEVPEDFLPMLRRNHPEEWEALFHFGTSWLDGHMLEKKAVFFDAVAGMFSIYLCDPCFRDLLRGARPDAALANGTWTGPVPPELQALTLAEQVVLGVSRSSQAAVFYLKSPVNDQDPLARQRATKGHFVSWPQFTNRVLEAITNLPIPPAELPKLLHITVVGPPPYDKNALRKVFAVSPSRLRSAWNFLRTRNPVYEGVTWDESVALQYDGGIPHTIKETHVEDTGMEEAERAGYVPLSAMMESFDAGDLSEDDLERDIPISSSGVVDGNGMRGDTQERRSGAIEAVLDPSSKSQLVLPRSTVLDSFFDPATMPRLCIAAYPYGVGGFRDNETSAYQSAPSLGTHIRTLLLRHDQRFAEHPFWLFYAFDMKQRMLVSKNTKVRMERSSGRRAASGIAGLTVNNLSTLATSIDSGESLTPGSAAESLLHACQWVSSGLVGSAQSRANSRKDLFALYTAFGESSFWWTLNFSDSHNVLTLHFAGEDVNFDKVTGLYRSLPSAQARRHLVAKNPVAAARAFNALLVGFIDILVQPTRDGSRTGIMGLALALYATLETQGRGSLHAHGQTTLHGQPSKAEILGRLKDPASSQWTDRFLEFIDGVIKNEFSETAEADLTRLQREHDLGDTVFVDDRHPTIRPATDPDLPEEEYVVLSEIDRAIVMFVSSSTRFILLTFTWICRYGFPRALVEKTHVSDAGQIVQRRLRPNTNSHNPSLCTFDHIRCNHDLKALFTDPTSCAFAFYMTKYMTKTELSLHRFYALAAASAELHQRARDDADGDVENARQFIVKCCNRVGAEMEFSAPAVAFYLLFNKDSFSTETFVGLYLAMFASRLAALERQALESQSDDAASTSQTFSEEAQQNSQTESVAVEIDEDGTGVVEHNQADDYFFRAEELSEECLYLFVSRYEIITKKGDHLDSRGAKSGFTANRRYDFGPSHPRFKTHRLRERSKPVIPRIEGRSVPRRNHPEKKYREWYAKAILMLFKAWRNLEDLKKKEETWEDALQRFQPLPHIQAYIDNLQLLHQMKDDAENELQQRQYPPQPIAGGLEHDDDSVDREKRTADILSPEEQAKALEAQLSVDLDDIWNRSAIKILGGQGYFSANSGHHEAPGIGIQEEDLSRASPVQFARRQSLNFKQTLAFLLMVNNALCKMDDPGAECRPVLVTGEGGTGKSRVIHSFTAWMDMVGGTRRVRVGAPTATAAAKIHGETLHRIAGISRGKKKKSGNVDDSTPLPSKPVDIATISDAVRADLEHLENMVVDEVSMLGHKLHARLHQTFCLAKAGVGSGSHMGGINTFYFGDFLQFRPVMDTALFSEPRKGVFNLWKNVTDVIILTEQMRQDPAQREFMKSLRKVRFRECEKEDYLLLQKRVIGTVGGPQLGDAEWQDTLFIVQRHSLRREINRRRAICLAQLLNQPVFVCPARYHSNKIAVTAKETKRLRDLSPRDHDNLESVLYLTIGMPLVLYDNDHTSQGITNGSYGTLVGIRLEEDDRDSFAGANGFRELVLQRPPAQLIIELRAPHPHRAQLSYLPSDTIPVMPREGSITLKVSTWRDNNGRDHQQTATIKALQSPVSAAWAVTDYRVQGETSPKVTADLLPPPLGRIDSAAAYVAMSRVTTFEGLSFLRDFPLDVLRTGLEDDLKEEIDRQEREEGQTLRRIREVRRI